MFLRRLAMLSSLTILSVPSPAFAFGIADILGTAIQAGTKIGGALVDTAFDSMKDPEAERKKKEARNEQQDRSIQAAFQKTLAEIEGMENLTPYQREKMKIKLIETMAQAASMAQFAQNMEERQAAERKAQREQLLTLGGIAGAVGEAALSSPSVTMARADQLSKSEDFKRGIRSGIADTDRRSVLSAREAAAVLTAPANAAEAQGRVAPAMADAQRQIDNTMAPMVAEAEAFQQAQKEKLTALSTPATTVRESFFSPDFEKRIFLDYIDNEREQTRIRDVLRQQGYNLADNRTDAEVYFRIEGEFLISDSPTHQALALSAGTALAQPESVKPPATKEKGFLQSTIGGALSLIRPQGATKEAAPETYKQTVLVVASRQTASEREMRLSALNRATSPYLQVEELVSAANYALYEKLGVAALLPRATPPEGVMAD